VDSQCKTEGDDEENLYGGPNEDAAMLWYVLDCK
jgi:hypothetical protein